MEEILRSIEREQHTREIFLGMFKEEGVSLEELEKAICESYVEKGFSCETINEIPISEIEEAICDCCTSAGLKFENFDDILQYFYKENGDI